MLLSRTRTVLVVASLAATTCALSGCVAVTDSPASSKSQTLAAVASRIDLISLTKQLASRIAVQNSIAFEVATRVTGVDTSTGASGVVDTTGDQLTSDAVQAQSNGLTSRLASDARASTNALATESQADASSLTGTTFTVTSVNVAPGISQVLSSDGRTAQAEINLIITRTLSDGTPWQERVPYELTVNQVSGVVQSLSAHDFNWTVDQDLTPAPADQETPLR